jgi:hypothetical protein
MGYSGYSRTHGVLWVLTHGWGTPGPTGAVCLLLGSSGLSVPVCPGCLFVCLFVRSFVRLVRLFVWFVRLFVSCACEWVCVWFGPALVAPALTRPSARAFVRLFVCLLACSFCSFACLCFAPLRRGSGRESSEYPSEYPCGTQCGRCGVAAQRIGRESALEHPRFEYHGVPRWVSTRRAAGGQCGVAAEGVGREPDAAEARGRPRQTNTHTHTQEHTREHTKNVFKARKEAIARARHAQTHNHTNLHARAPKETEGKDCRAEALSRKTKNKRTNEQKTDVGRRLLAALLQVVVRRRGKEGEGNQHTHTFRAAILKTEPPKRHATFLYGQPARTQ